MSIFDRAITLIETRHLGRKATKEEATNFTRALVTKYSYEGGAASFEINLGRSENGGGMKSLIRDFKGDTKGAALPLMMP